MRYFSKVFSVQTTGLRARVIDVEVDVTKKTLYAFAVVGLPDKAVEESRDRISAAIKNSGFTSPKNQNQKVVISLAPADLKKEGPSFDLPMAIAYLLAVNDISFDPTGKLFLGELSLDGAVRPIKGVLVLTQEAKKQGFKEIYLPKENAAEGALIEGISVFGIKTLKELVEHLHEKHEKGAPQESPKLQPEQRAIAPSRVAPISSVDFSDVRGQESAKRGLLLAAGGGHNVAMYGPPGTGKTMLARAFAEILPELSFNEALEVTGIHSVAGTLEGHLMTGSPFRSPHHTASYTSIVGGGSIPKPGEITLAHRGVLFLDEFPEFEKRVLESLRQPLEDKIVNISRVKGSAQFPANFILVAAMNPCPCGNYGTEKTCTCTPSHLLKYQRKLSGPIMDRIDIWLSVGSVDHRKLSEKSEGAESSAHIRERVSRARAIQRKRFQRTARNITTNSEMGAREITEFIFLGEDVKQMLNQSSDQMGLSARAYHKVIKVARTIADLAGAEEITEGHLMEALQYRPRMHS